MEAIMEEIEALKARMIEVAHEFGYTAPETVNVSQTLDIKLNELQKMKEAEKYVC